MPAEWIGGYRVLRSANAYLVSYLCVFFFIFVRSSSYVALQALIGVSHSASSTMLHMHAGFVWQTLPHSLMLSAFVKPDLPYISLCPCVFARFQSTDQRRPSSVKEGRLCPQSVVRVDTPRGALHLLLHSICRRGVSRPSDSVR